jgi:hypothetical protein
MSNGVERGTREILSRPQGVLLGAEYNNEAPAPNADEINLEEDSEVRMGKAARYLGARAVGRHVAPIFMSRDNDILESIREKIRSGRTAGREVATD